MGEISLVFITILVLLIYMLTLKLISNGSKTKYSSLLLVSALALLFVTPIYLPFFNNNLYLGQWSPNIWHSPTIFMVKPFVLLIFFIISISIVDKNLEINNFRKVLLSFLLLISSIAKPSFVFSFIPAFVLYHILYHIRSYRYYIISLLIILPCVLFLMWQYLNTYNVEISQTNDLQDKIIFTFFGVTKLYTPNVFISLLLAICFPLSVVVIDFRNVLLNRILVLCWINTLIAYLQASFLAEKFKFDQAAFTFGYSIALFPLFIFSFIHFLNFSGNKSKNINNFLLKFIFVISIFCAHLVSGIYYYIKYVYFGKFY
jgi:uncharacterized membrane protein